MTNVIDFVDIKSKVREQEIIGTAARYKMKIILTTLLSFLIYLCYAQLDTKAYKQNNIAVTIGYTQFKEENLHPKIFRGITFAAQYYHTKIKENISEYSAGLKFSGMNTYYENFPAAAGVLILGNYRYLFASGKESERWYFGPVADLQFGTNAYFNWDESHLYFANYLSGGIGSRYRFNKNNKTFNIDLDFPLVSIICRPEFNRQYKIDDMTFGGVFNNLSNDPEVVLLNKNFFVKSSLEMRFLTKSNKTRLVGFNIKYHYMRVTDGNPFQNIEYSVMYKFILKSR